MGILRKLVGTPAVEGELAPELRGVSAWINSEPLTMASLRGTVVLLEIWTYGCINCVRTLPFLRQAYERYHPQGVEFVGVHTPEFDFERDEGNVRDAVARFGLTWPIAMDNGFETWNAYRNRYWPHIFLIDRAGRVRFDFIGEGHDQAIERGLRALREEPATASRPA